VGWNASAISGEYLSAASFMGIAGMAMSSGYDSLWYPVCYACGYLFLLLFIAGPLRRFGAYTIPDFAEGRFDSPLFRKIAVIFVLFIGFFYTMPQMKGAGTTLKYIFPNLPYSAGVVLVGAVITLNVALGGMKGITLVQAFQYWAKMFAISVPIFVLMSVYGNYGKQLQLNDGRAKAPASVAVAAPVASRDAEMQKLTDSYQLRKVGAGGNITFKEFVASTTPGAPNGEHPNVTANISPMQTEQALDIYQKWSGRPVYMLNNLPPGVHLSLQFQNASQSEFDLKFGQALVNSGVGLVRFRDAYVAMRVGDMPRFNEAVDWVEKGATTSAPQVATAAASAPLENSPAISGRKPLPEKAPKDDAWIAPFGPLTTKAAKAAKLSPEQTRPLSLLYTYSLIIALVCGTAGLPHILVRFYTNPDGVAAKRTTMWVMILIGIFYVFPPVFGVMGRNLLPDLYAGTGAKGTDKIVLELPRLLNERVPMLGSILSGITCAGAFAAFMSTFSGLLVSMTGAMAHDVYGRILRPNSTPQQRMKAFKIAAFGIGAVAVLLGMQVEQLQINFMVGQAFAIAAASYFPLLFMAVWWRGLTMIGAATGMLTGGLLALLGISLTSFSDLAAAPDASAFFKLFNDLNPFWASHPLLRILCEQPAIWAVPLAIICMIVVSKLTRNTVPTDIRMKMLVLHAPEQLGLKQEYIQDHTAAH
jgi:Na+(H+)/acetate symporter ActP